MDTCPQAHAHFRPILPLPLSLLLLQALPHSLVAAVAAVAQGMHKVEDERIGRRRALCLCLWVKDRYTVSPAWMH